MEEIDFNRLKRLWNCRLVTETGSIKRAATRAKVTSSAMSQSISGLEESLGRKLLLRKKGQLLPTEYGSQLLRSASSAFGECVDLQRNMFSDCQVAPKITWLDFAATESLAVEILPYIMQRLRKQFPGIRLKVKSGQSSTLTKLVKNAELCMAIVEENEFLDGVAAIPLAEDRLGFYCSNKESIQKFKVNAIHTLGVGVLTAGADGYPLYYSKFLRVLGKGFKPTLTSESYEILRAAAVEGSVVGILPTRVARRRPGELIEIFPESINAKKRPLDGAYKIYLVSEPGCTPEENIFLAQELKSLISGSGP